MANNLTLAVTKIGDLLLRGNITRGVDGKPITDVNLTIPEYQRPYKWTARNAIQLLDDIIEAMDNNKEVYRVGTLILHHTAENDNDNVYKIVDGQQRTITFSLLLYALYELKGKTIDIPFLEQSVFDNQYSRHNIPNNLNAFRRRVGKRKESTEEGAEESIEDAEHRRNMERIRIFIESQCELIVVITDDISEAFQFFDSQNARGKALYPHDLLKAFHLREMSGIGQDETERIVKQWEQIPQKDLASFFGNYLYRIKEWINGNWAHELNEKTIHKFKGVTKFARTPYAQFYKSAFAYADLINSSSMPFVSGMREVNAFQLNTPIIAGKPFFEYTNHYYSILKDIQDNRKYEGFYVNGNNIVETLDKYYNKGTGNSIVRLLFDTSLLLYVDRFCPATYPTQLDIDMFEQFLIYAFIWAYSLRAQYFHLGWLTAQNYVLGRSEKKNSINIYRLISDSDTPASLLSTLADKICPLSNNDLPKRIKNLVTEEELKKKDNDEIYLMYLSHFRYNQFYSL